MVCTCVSASARQSRAQCRAGEVLVTFFFAQHWARDWRALALTQVHHFVVKLFFARLGRLNRAVRPPVGKFFF